jgi:hypothetical protein
VSGWDDCNTDWSDGCERDLTTNTDCGGCGVACTAGANATANCDANGDCQRSCQVPYENCDGDWSNGCEIPTGLANTCDQDGLASDGCGTAWCGTGGIVDFSGNWTCVTCANCHEFSSTDCSWCQQSTGYWYYSSGTYCNAGPDPCGSSADLVCSP